MIKRQKQGSKTGGGAQNIFEMYIQQKPKKKSNIQMRHERSSSVLAADRDLRQDF